MNYQEYIETRQKEFNALPIFYAFSNEQFKTAMEERGLTENDTDKIYRFGDTGGFYLRKDAPIIQAYFDKIDPLPELMKEYDFAKEAILYEMQNHEYGINWQADYDVCSCFGRVQYTESETELQEYFEQLEWPGETQRAYKEARKEYFILAIENDWL